jgi:hypothetical protein
MLVEDDGDDDEKEGGSFLRFEGEEEEDWEEEGWEGNSTERKKIIGSK